MRIRSWISVPAGVQPPEAPSVLCEQEHRLGKFRPPQSRHPAIWTPQPVIWLPWIDGALKSFCDDNWITWTGPAASGKSFNASLLGLEYWLEYPEGTRVIMTSTTKGALSRRL
jgi:hypothetical protein